ncbi:MAG: tRNA (5-methylaminomethyl-2-thiouridylate)-methyltransferase, partial [Candidatus Cloacimonas sp.]|nr:7-cyano-7-deazaguanine synthase [Candidatus Cloacimonadota bacterium]
MKSKGKALALFSGGLDSQLALLYMARLGYEVIPIFFQSYFFTAERAIIEAERIGYKLKVIDIGEKMLDLINQPRYGFGKNMNPCIDCHSLMFREAGRLMQELEADFLISGEVLGQRPMSQRMDALQMVSKHSGFRDYI